MRAPVRLLLLALALGLVGAAAASESPDSRNATPSRIEKVPATADVKPEARRLPLTADQLALDEIMQRGQRDALTLAAGLADLPAGPARDALQRKIVEVKLRTRVEFLRALAAQQRTRGRFTDALATDAVAEQILHPAPVTALKSPQGLNRSREVK